MNPFDDWFMQPGAYVLVDGQFGSTGKGLLAGYIAAYCRGRITHVTTNAGPNSGHTAYHNGEKIVTQQIPIASVVLKRMGHDVVTIINAGAIIDPDIFDIEEAKLQVHKLRVHPCAAIITPDTKFADKATEHGIAGTGKGVGPAIQAKMARLGEMRIAKHHYLPMFNEGEIHTWDAPWDWTKDRVFVETAQGFSLGLNSSRFYPHVTSRECTVMQAIADARIPAQMVRKVVATFRTFPIRVGNTSGSSGDCYPDQRETTWEELGVEPEITTVTKRVRRVFTWSRQQFRECVATNRPDVIFLNFCNYLDTPSCNHLVADLMKDYHDIMGHYPEGLIQGFGPLPTDLQVCF